MSDEAQALIDELTQQGAALQALASEIAAEISLGRAAQITQVDIRRPQIMRLIAALNGTILRCGAVPAHARSGALQQAVNYYRPQPGFWAQCDRLLRQQLPPRPRPFVGARSDEPTLNSVQIDAANTLLGVLHFALKANEQSSEAYEFGCHDDIPLIASSFFTAAHAAYRVLLAQSRAAGARFLDIGCGNGMKLLSAAPYFDQCDGLEYQDTSVTAAKALLASANASRCAVFQGDATTYDGYDGYEVIYLYKPMRDPEVLMALEDRVVAQAKPGTVLIAPYYEFRTRSEELGCGRVTGDVYVTATDQEAADALRQEAEFTGLGLSKQAAPGLTLWDPIIQASAARGFVVLPSASDFVT